MTPSRTVDLADRYSKKRALILAMGGAAVLFGAVFALLRHGDADRLVTYGAWSVEIVLFLIVLATGGSLRVPRGIREVMNDEGMLRHRGQALAAGFWTAMAACLALLGLDSVHPMGAGAVITVIGSSAVGVSLVTFAWLELRAFRDA